jgi:hypothetical protein
VWIDLRGYWGNESFITDAFVRPYHVAVGVFENGLNATLRFVHNTRTSISRIVSPEPLVVNDLDIAELKAPCLIEP